MDKNAKSVGERFVRLWRETSERRAYIECALISVLAAALLFFCAREGVIFERIANNSPYKILGEVTVCLHTAIIIGIIVIVYRFLPAFIRKYVLNAPTRSALIFIIVLGVTLRLAAMLHIMDMSAICDTLEYQLAQSIALLGGEQAVEGSLRESYLIYASKFSQDAFYPTVILPSFINMLGDGALTALLPNLIIEAVNIALIMWNARLLSKKDVAFAAALLYAVWPQQIVGCLSVNTSLFAISVFLICIGLAQYITGGNNCGSPKNYAAFAPLLLGAALALGFWSTPGMVFIAPAIILFSLANKGDAPREGSNTAQLIFSSRITRTVLVVMGAALSYIVLNANMTGILQRDVPSPVLRSGYYFMTGLNAETSGDWNEADADVIESAPDAFSGQTRAMEIARERVRAMTPGEFLRLADEKLAYIWRVIRSARIGQQGLEAVGGTYIDIIAGEYPMAYLVIIFFAIFGIFMRMRTLCSVSAATAAVAGAVIYQVFAMPVRPVYMEIWTAVLLLASQCAYQKLPALVENEAPLIKKIAPPKYDMETISNNDHIRITMTDTAMIVNKELSEKDARKKP